MARDLMRTVERVYIEKDIMDGKGDYAYTLRGESVAPEYDLSWQDMQGLYDILYPAFSKPCLYPDNGVFTPSTDFMMRLYDVFSTAFAYGYVLGHRATIAGKYRELKKKDIRKADIHDKHKKERA